MTLGDFRSDATTSAQVPSGRKFADPQHWSPQYWIEGDGPKPARIAFVGEAPGREEEREGRPFVGAAGQVNWLFASRYAGLGRQGNYVTNWRKIGMSGDEKKELSDEEKSEWTELLEEELEEVQPEVIVALGAYAVEALLGPGHSLFWSTGIPFWLGWPKDNTVVVPITHPAAGLHDPNQLQGTVEGYKGLRRYLDGKVEARRGWARNPAARSWREFGDRPFGRHLFVDTEGFPYCLQFAVDASEGFIIYADDHEGIRWFVEKCRRERPVFVFHHALHDVPVVRTMTGLDCWAEGFDVLDTMVYAFILQDLPRGLKPLTHRLLGIQMKDYEDVVRPWWETEDAQWLAKAAARAYGDLTAEQQLTPKGKPKMSKGQPVYKMAGPELQLSLVKHVERKQQLKPAEQLWAERQVGPRPQMELKHVPKELAEDYACRDAAVTAGIFPRLQEQIDAEGLAVVADLDMQCLPMFSDMQAAGMHVDLTRYHEVLGGIATEKAELTEALRSLTGNPEFNPGSGDQVEAYCNQVAASEGKLRLSKLTASKKRFSTNDNALSLVKNDHPFPALELKWRALDKLENSYLLPIQPEISEVAPGEYRAFFDINATKVVSGRLAGRALTWPTREDASGWGPKMRSFITAPPGRKLVSWDLSQIELRLVAAFSKDPVMLEIFLKNLDPHTQLASKLFQKTYEECHVGEGRRLYRGPAKNINYGWVYGMSDMRLYEECMAAGVTAYSREDYRDMLEDTRRVYHVCDAFLKGCADEARRNGYVSDWLGRRRYLPGCQLPASHWSLRKVREESERQAGNYKIQAANSELVRRALVTVRDVVYPTCRAQGVFFRLWLFMHDELMGEIDGSDRAWELVNPMMVAAMTQDNWLIDPIPIETEGKRGDSWADLK